jgi:hypothetical protein
VDDALKRQQQVERFNPGELEQLLTRVRVLDAAGEKTAVIVRHKMQLDGATWDGDNLARKVKEVNPACAVVIWPARRFQESGLYSYFTLPGVTFVDERLWLQPGVKQVFDTLDRELRLSAATPRVGDGLGLGRAEEKRTVVPAKDRAGHLPGE